MRLPDSLRTIGGGATIFALLLWWGTGTDDIVNQGRLIMALPYAMGALSIYLITGLAGQISIAQATMMGMGAVILFNLTGAPYGQEPRMGQVPAVIITLVAVTVIGMLVAIPALRIRGLHFAVVTLAFAYTADTVLFSEGTSVGYDPQATFVDKPAFIASDNRYIMWGIIVVAVMALLMTNLRRSPFGRGLMAVRDSEVAASVVGINVAKYKTLAFMLASIMASIGGIFYAWYVSNASNTFSGVNVVQGLLLFAFVVIGGMRRVSGAVLAGLLFIFMPSIMAEKFNNTYYVEFLAGIGVVALVVLLPDGLVTLPNRLVASVAGLRQRRTSLEIEI